MTFEGLPPAERAIDDVIAGVIRFSLGGKPYAMAVLPMGAHDRWQESLDSDLQTSFDAVPNRPGAAQAEAIAAAFRANRKRMLDALIAYDRDGVLPPLEEIVEIATQQDIIAALREVRAVGGDPLGAVALSAAGAKRRLWMEAASIRSPEPTKRSRRTTAGRSRSAARR